MNRKIIISKTAQLSEITIEDCEKVVNALTSVIEDEFRHECLSSAFDKFCKLINVFKIKLI